MATNWCEYVFLHDIHCTNLHGVTADPLYIGKYSHVFFYFTFIGRYPTILNTTELKKFHCQLLYWWCWRRSLALARRFFISRLSRVPWSKQKQYYSCDQPCNQNKYYTETIISIIPLRTRRFHKAFIICTVALRTSKQRNQTPHRPIIATYTFARVKSAVTTMIHTGNTKMSNRCVSFCSTTGLIRQLFGRL